MVEVVIKQKISGQQIADLATAGIEGGCSPWLESIKPRSWKGDDPWYASASFWDGFFEIAATFDGPEDLEGSFASITVVGPEDLQRAFTQMPAHHLADFLNDNSDAETGDVFLQLLILGEIVYG